MLRRLLAGSSAALLPVGAVCSLFVHAHLDDHDTPHHRGRQVHAHFSEHQTSRVHHDRKTTAIDHDDEEETIDMQVFVAVSSDGHIVPEPPSGRFAALISWAPAPRPMHRVTHGHDPPFVLAHVGSRPPPTASL